MQVFLSVTARRPDGDSTDLGFLMAKHPDRVQDFSLPFGTAWVYYPRATPEATTIALHVEVDPVGLVRNRRFRADGFALAAYVNDRPYAASSLLAVAIKRVFGTALKGVCHVRPELVEVAWDLTIVLPALGVDTLAVDLFEPLGWRVEVGPVASRCVLRGDHTVADALSHLYVLLPVLDGSKHYWVDTDEVDKLVTHGGTWLASHPMRETITRRYLAGQRALIAEAAKRFASLDEEAPAEAEEDTESRTPLAVQRRAAIVEILNACGARRVVDAGCGEGALVADLMRVPRIEHVLGLDVSTGQLAKAEQRLRLEDMPERQRERVTLAQSSLTYVDARLASADAVVLSEVIEHIDEDRLTNLEAAVFPLQPANVVVTTPNAEYNEVYGLTGYRHTDHRFEWSRAQFEQWARGVAGRNGYHVTFHGVGDNDPRFGSSTQLAHFEVIR